jgi:murein DD-endopeptidase MepM/ murein hydrolase activator NlpD
VPAGQAIGRVGDSGTSLKGTVLHFEVRNGGSALDPEDWLR